MKILELIAHWAFAFFVTIISFLALLALFAFLITKVAPTSEAIHNMVVLNLAAYCAIIVPFMAASFMGIVTAPYAQRRIASIVFPAFVFLAVNLVCYCYGQNYKFSLHVLLMSGASSAVIGALFYLRWKQRLLKKLRK